MSFSDESTEDALVEALIKSDLAKVMNVLITDVLADGDVKSAKILQSIFDKFSKIFDKSEDINAIMGLVSQPVIQNNMGKLMESVSNINPDHIAGKKFKYQLIFST